MTNDAPAQANVEAVARIIDPSSWEAYDHAYSMQVGEFRRFADRTVQPSLETASAVLASLSPPPTVGAEDGWQDISTAPKDGSEALVTGFIWNDPSKGRWQQVAAWNGYGWATEQAPLPPPTHWKPLGPEPVSCIASEKGASHG